MVQENLWYLKEFLPSAAKLRQGNVFTSMFKNSVQGGGGVSASMHTGMHPSQAGTPLGRYTPWQVHLHPQGGTPPPGKVHLPLGRYSPPHDSHCSRRYASYWNAFFFGYKIIHIKKEIWVTWRYFEIIFSFGDILNFFSNFFIVFNAYLKY